MCDFSYFSPLFRYLWEIAFSFLPFLLRHYHHHHFPAGEKGEKGGTFQTHSHTNAGRGRTDDDMAGEEVGEGGGKGRIALGRMAGKGTGAFNDFLCVKTFPKPCERKARFF